MFCPVDHPMERGWVGRIEGEQVIQLAAQTLQSFFTGGGKAREHAVYPLDAVRFLAPVLHPPAVRIFEKQDVFEFANPAAIVGPDAQILRHGRGPPCNRLLQGALTLLPRMAAVIGAGGEIAAFTASADWRAPAAQPPKDRDFALGLGPVALTADELDADDSGVVVRVDGTERLRAPLDRFDWAKARNVAAECTTLNPGDLLVGPAAKSVEGLGHLDTVELELEGIGTLRQVVA